MNFNLLNQSTQERIAKTLTVLILILIIAGSFWLIGYVFDFLHITDWFKTPIAEMQIWHLLIVGFLIGSSISIKVKYGVKK